MKYLRLTLYALGAAIVLVGGAVAYFVLTFDARDYVPRVAALVKEKTGRTLGVEGEIGFGVWPYVSLDLAGASLTERDGTARFASAQRVRIALEVKPLLSRELVARELFLEGAEVHLVRFADGRLNVDDLLRGEGPTPRFDFASIKVERSRIDYRDLGSGAYHELREVKLETGRIANVTDSPIALAFAARDGADALDIACSLGGKLVFDLDRRTYALEKATLKVDGRAFDIAQLSATLAASVSADFTSNEFRLKDVSGAARGERSGLPFAIALRTGGAIVQAGRVRSDSATMRVALSRGADTANANATLEGFDYSVNGMSARSAAVETHVQHAGRTIDVTAISAVAYDGAARRFTLADLRSRLSAGGAGLPRDGITGALSGRADLDIGREVLEAVLAGTVADSAVKARVGVTGFGAPQYTFAIDVDRFDADRYAVGSRSGVGSPAEFDLSALSAWPATGTLRIGVLRTSGVTAKNVRLVVKP